jgi:hypothetical protein
MVELPTMVVPGLLSHEDTGLAISSAFSPSRNFSALPHAEVFLHWQPRSSATNVTAIYVGGNRKDMCSEVSHTG